MCTLATLWSTAAHWKHIQGYSLTRQASLVILLELLPMGGQGWASPRHTWPRQGRERGENENTSSVYWQGAEPAASGVGRGKNTPSPPPFALIQQDLSGPDVHGLSLLELVLRFGGRCGPFPDLYLLPLIIPSEKDMRVNDIKSCWEIRKDQQDALLSQGHLPEVTRASSVSKKDWSRWKWVLNPHFFQDAWELWGYHVFRHCAQEWDI